MCITFFCLYPFSLAQKQKMKQNQIITEEKRRLQISEQDNTCMEDRDVRKQRIKFVLAFNRDEQSYRETLKMGPFSQDPNIYAGRDLKSTGTWLGVNIKTGIMVILTNYDLPVFRPGKSRGQLVKSFLLTQFVPEQMMNQHLAINKKINQKLNSVLEQSKLYSAFNLMVYNIRDNALFYICSETGMKQAQRLDKNTIYGLCNSDLSTIWPKTKHGLGLFTKTLSQIKNFDEQEIINAIIDKVMKDKVSFSENPNDQASIFLQPFYSTLQNAQRMTKSTFVTVIKQLQDKKGTQIIMKQITHKDPTYKQKKEQAKNFDHVQEVVTNFRFIL